MPSDGPVAHVFGQVQARAVAMFLSHPRLLGLVARHAPVLRLPLPRMVLLWRHDDVTELLRRDHDAGVVYMPRMRELGAPFLLGLDDSNDYRRERAAARAAVEPGDLERIARHTRERAEHHLAGAGDRVEVLGAVVDPVLQDTMEAYLGVGRLTAEQLADARAAFTYVFMHRWDRATNRRAERGSRALCEHLDGLVASRRAALGNERPADVLGRLLSSPLCDEDVRNLMIGLIVAWASNVFRATAAALHGLLARPEALETARLAVRLGDDHYLRGHLLEALRFSPPTPALERRTVREVDLRGRRIPRDRVVVAVVATAVMDGRAVASPARFRAGRPAQETLQFGHGRHRCLGERIAGVQMTEVAAVLLRRGVALAGRLEKRGSWPRALSVRLDGSEG